MSAVACGQIQSSQTEVKGHFENSSAANIAPYANKLTNVPEYQPAGKVIFGLPVITNYKKEDLIAKVLKAGVEVVIGIPSNSTETINSPTFAKLRTLVGADINKVKLINSGVAGNVTVWSRNWGPQGAYDANGKLVLLDFNYYTFYPGADNMNQHIASAYSLDRVSIPVYHDGGNFMNNDNGLCMTSSRVTDANATSAVPSDTILSTAQIKDYYLTYGGCKELMIFPVMPYEPTGHIDLWTKFLNNDTIIVNEIRPETISLITNTTQKQMANEINDYLNARATEIKAKGLKVIRIPMPSPEVKSGNVIMRSYTNSLTLNGKAILTQYKNYDNGTVASSYTDASLLPSYETEVSKVFQNAGYQISFILSDQLISTFGAVHCATMQVPK